MGKNQRHKKQLRSEKGKIKFKTSKTKFLPKGQNVTDVSFKIKPIVVQEQLRSNADGELLSKRKLNVKDILSRLRHHNTTMKVDNCMQLKDLICTYPDEILRQHLAQILQGVLPLILDVEKKVRNEAMRILKAVLSLVSESNVESFFGMLSSYLRCSMTHIDRNVQEDSLLLLGGFLEYVPTLVAKNSDLILQNFFTLISKLKGDSKPGRTLTEDLKSKHTGVRWRIKVLCRLKDIFEALRSHKTVAVNSVTTAVPVVRMKNINAVPLYVDKFCPCHVDFFSDNTEVCRNTEEPMAKYVDTLMPLLYETWLEIAPSISMDVSVAGLTNSTVLKEEDCIALSCILNLMYLCWQLAEIFDAENKNSLVKSKFNTKTTSQLLGVLVKTFPYSRTDLQKQSSRAVEIYADTKCVRENILVCFLFVVLNRKLQDNGRIEVARCVMSYLNYCLLNRNYVQSDNVKLLLSLLRRVHFENRVYWTKAVDFDELTRNTLRFYQNNSKMSKEDSVELLYMSCELIQSSETTYRKLLDISSISSNLLLEKEIQVETLDLLLSLVKRNLLPVHKSVRNNLRPILENLSKVKILGTDDHYLGVTKILSLYYYVSLTSEDIEDLASFGDKSPEYKNFIVGIMIDGACETFGNV